MAVIGAHKLDLGMDIVLQPLSVVYPSTIGAWPVATQTPIQQDLQAR
jgi:hypothetical protein